MNLFGTKNKKYEEDRIPVSVDDVIPIRESCDDGMCLVGKNLWSKTYRFSDINYATASKEIKEDLFMAYSEILNSLDSGADTKITINNRRLIKSRFEKTNMLLTHKILYKRSLIQGLYLIYLSRKVPKHLILF